MPRKIHMLDQVGHSKVDEIMNHYNQSFLELWAMKFAVIGMFLLLGVYW